MTMQREPPPGFGPLLKRYRRAAGLTQEALAEQARLSTRAISDLERGIIQAPRQETVALLAGALGLSAAERAMFRAAACPSDDRAAPGASPPLGMAQWDTSGTMPGPLPLIGRTVERALLGQHLAGAGPPLLLLAGEPGIGKSRLLALAAQEAAVQGWRVLAAGCTRRAGQEPYAPLLGALAGYLAAQSPVDLRADLAGCAWLVRLLPELADGPIPPLPAWALAPAQERRLLFAAVGRFLANVAGPAGTLLVLDDLQWAGPDALDLLASVVRGAGRGPVRVVGAYRETEAGSGDPLAALLADLAHAGLATQHTLHPLTSEEAVGLLDAMLEGADDERAGLRDQVVQRTGGIPFFIVSWARALQAGPAEERRADTLPWDVSQSVRQRVSTLSVTAREVLGVAAVVGRVVPRALLVAATAQPVDELLEALESACQARLLDEQGTDTYQFAHDMIREVVEGDLSAARRALLHQRVAVALEQAPGAPPIEALAYHYARSDDQDKAVQYLEEAADLAQAQYANATAADSYRRAVVLLDRLGRTPDAARVREKLGAALITMGQYDAALAVLEQAEEVYRALDDWERVAGTLAEIGHTFGLSQRASDGVARLQAVLPDLAVRGPSHGLAALHAALAELFWASGRSSEGLAAAERAVALARAVGDQRLLGGAEERRATLLRTMVGRWEEALEAAEDACRAAEVVGDLETLAYALDDRAEIAMIRGALERAEGDLERALALAERQGNPFQTCIMLYMRAMLNLFRGAWDQARIGLQQTEAIRSQLGVDLPLGYPILQAELALVDGALEEVSPVLEEHVTKLERRGWLDGLRGMHRVLAERDLLEGRPQTARARIVPLLDRPGLQEFCVNNLVPLLAWAHLETGEIEEAARLAAEAIARMRRDDDRLELVAALRVQAMVAIRQERWGEAEQALEEGITLAQAMPYPYAEGRLLHVYGQMHLGKGEAGPARERLEEALTIFRRLGARNDAERVAQAMDALPARA